MEQTGLAGLSVTASLLYDLVACERRVYNDRFANRTLRDPIHPFVEWLWRNGRALEESLVTGDASVLDLRDVPIEERERATLQAMDRREPLIYGGRLSAGDLLGEPDLLRLEQDGYAPIDIKSGAGLEDDGGIGKPKTHYAMQVALYVDILECIGRSAGRYAYVWDPMGEEVRYDLTVPKGPRSPQTLWADYEVLVAKARAILAREMPTTPANSSICALCHWRTTCMGELIARDDLTLLPELGRSRRDPLLPFASTIKDFAASVPAQYLDSKGKSVVKGFSDASLAKFIGRARLRVSGGPPYAKQTLSLPESAVEVILDIEDHSFRDHCYLHGMLVRRNGDAEAMRYDSFVSKSPSSEAERAAFAEAWAYLSSLRSAVLFTYSKHERTWWRKLQQRYSDICSAEEIEALFSKAIDLYYDVVLPKTEWPTNDFSLKTLATYCGFRWRDDDPSGAASIVWYDDYIAGDASALERIIEYNEDDCRATLTLLDAIRALPVHP
jgi:uncharacterized protein